MSSVAYSLLAEERHHKCENIGVLRWILYKQCM